MKDEGPDKSGSHNREELRPFRVAASKLPLAGVCAAAQVVAAVAALLSSRAFSLPQARVLAEVLFLGAAAAATLLAFVMVRTFSRPAHPSAGRELFVQKTSLLLEGLWLLFAAASIVLVVWGRLKDPKPEFPGTSPSSAAAAVSLAMAFGFYVLVKILKNQDTGELPESETFALWLSNSQWILVAGAVSFLLPAANLQGPVPVILWAVSLWTLALCLEMALHAISSFFRTPPSLDRLHRSLRLFLLMALYSRKNPIAGITHSFEEYFSVDFRASWAIRFIGRSLPSLVLLLGLILWASTSLVALQPEEQGFKERFGKLQEGILEPGLHLKWPWPIEVVRKFDARRVRSFPIGYEPTGTPEDFIWMRPHGRQEYRFVVGNANELISIDAVIDLRIKDLIQFAFEVYNPWAALQDLAYRVFMKETVLLTVDQILSRDRCEFAQRIQERLQDELDSERLGIEILYVNLKSIHPPLQVAQAYQQVVSSALAKETEILRGKAYKASKIPEAERDGVTKRADAQVFSSQRKGKALGESNRFRSIEAAHRKSPDLFELRRRLETIQEGLESKRIVVIDDRLFEGEIEKWIDLRPFKSLLSSEEMSPYIDLGGDRY